MTRILRVWPNKAALAGCAVLAFWLFWLSWTRFASPGIIRVRIDELVDVNLKPRPAWRAIDGAIVMGRRVEEDTSWVELELPEWQHYIYIVDDDTAPLHTPMNKGHEAMPYLTFIIDHYANLPETIVFLHPHRHAAHGESDVNGPGYSNVVSVQYLNRDFVQRNGYANLRCAQKPGCPAEISPTFEEIPDVDNERWKDRFMMAAWMELFNATEPPPIIGVACCAQFAVSRDQVRRRSLNDYIHFRDWIFNTWMEDDTSGRMFEYLWHIIFGQDAVYCPDTRQCYMDVYRLDVIEPSPTASP